MKKAVGTLVLVLAVALLAWAGDPWKEKPYNEWNEKDVRKVLTDSPWAKNIRVSVSWRPVRGGADTGYGPPAGNAGAQPAEQSAEAGMNPGQSSNPVSPSEMGVRTPQAEFIIRWASALTVRQAIVRSAELAGNPLASAEDLLHREPDFYQIVVVGQDLTPFARSNEEELKSNTELRIGSSKKKIAPVAVQLLRAGQGGRLQGVLFQFPKRDASGEAVVSAEEKSLEFVCEAKNLTLRAKFDPRKMTGHEGADL